MKRLPTRTHTPILTRTAGVLTLFALVLGAMPVTFSSCIEDGGVTTRAERPISFGSSIVGPDIDLRPELSTRAASEDFRAAPVTRADEPTPWKADDRIGVYMIVAGGTIAGNSLAVNVLHSHAGSGVFVAEQGGLFFPPAQSVDFVAYTPWRPTGNTTGGITGNHLYPIDVADQSSPAALDLLYSDNATGHTTGDSPTLRFRHVLTRIIFDVTAAEGVLLEGMQLSVSGLKRRGGFDLSAGTLALDPDSAAAIVTSRSSSTAASSRFEAIVLPDRGVAPVVILAFGDGTTSRLPLPDSELASAKTYIYKVRVTAAGRAELTGSAEIVDWIDSRSTPVEISKTESEEGDGGSDDGGSGGGDDGGGDDDGSSGGGGGDDDGSGGNGPTNPSDPTDPDEYYFQEKFDDEGGWLDFPAGEFPEDVTVDVPAGYRDITMSYDITAYNVEEGIERPPFASDIRVYIDDVNADSKVIGTFWTGNEKITISFTVPDGTTEIRFSGDMTDKSYGMRIDNLRLSGRQRPQRF
ncbi:MAG: fimbrillin family protein [Alistipes sp.]|jgi:uncharacterized membrane protein YgcG|nr:fimbrillin family protein [Alistipes sp.]